MPATLTTPPDAPSTVAALATVVLAPPRRLPTTGARAHRLIARALLGGLALQLFFAGLGVFGIATFLPHALLGTVIIAASFALPLIAWRGRLEATVQRLSWLLTGLMLLQGGLIDLGRVVHVVWALHPVNAMLLVLVTYSLARRRL